MRRSRSNQSTLAASLLLGTALLGASCGADDASGGSGDATNEAGAGGVPSPANDASGVGGQLEGELPAGFGGASGTLGAAGAIAAAGTLDAGGGAGEATQPSDPGHDTCHFPPAALLANAALSPGFCAWVWADGTSAPRGLKTDAAGNVLAVSGATGNITAFWDDDGDGVSGPTERLIVATAQSLTHGIELSGGYLYASSEGQVLRWPYVARTVLGTPQVVIKDIPTTGHRTRTLRADAQFLYVSVGAGTNIDPDSTRARIVRFELASLGGAARSFATGELFADGLRNTVGLGLDARGRLWGVDNGPDGMNRADLGDVHEDNPGEEVNLFQKAGSFYGYPYCWSEFLLPGAQGIGRGGQWASIPFFGDGVHTDAWCRSPANVVGPALALQAHSAPLDILFYQGHSFPSSFVGGAFISLHGSWNRTVPTGYRVVYVGMGPDGLPSAAPVPVLASAGPGESWSNRPVGLTVLPNGVLLISNDYGVGNVLALGYKPPTAL